MGWGGFFDKLMGILPIQKRRERWKNEIDSLTAERKKLLAGAADEKKSMRLDAIDLRINVLTGLLKNSTDA